MEIPADLCDQAAERILTTYRAGHLIRHHWYQRLAGNECVCLLSAAAPEVLQYAKDNVVLGDVPSSACPVELMPTWFAELTPWLSDMADVATWATLPERYAAALRRNLTPERWARLFIEIQELFAGYLAEDYLAARVPALRVSTVNLTWTLIREGRLYSAAYMLTMEPYSDTLIPAVLEAWEAA